MKKVSKLINFPENLMKQIEVYQQQNGIASFTATVLELIRKGLEAGYLNRDSSPD